MCALHVEAASKHRIAAIFGSSQFLRLHFYFYVPFYFYALNHLITIHRLLTYKQVHEDPI